MKNPTLSNVPRVAFWWAAFAWVVMAIVALGQCVLVPLVSSPDRVAVEHPAIARPIEAPALLRHVVDGF
jgi:hypothetical protein